MTSNSPGRGRPKLHSDEQILEAALRMFATHGYDGMSLRSLNRELGLSHSAIHQRFGTKEDLYKAVIDHEFGAMFSEIRNHLRALPRPDTPLAELQSQFKAFLIVSSKHPYLNRLMNNEGLEDSWHLDHIYK
ncbi:MAG: TetR/AcrR family transcriptional regulator, partial [Actinobacteria bacterium]|nr:TetR/AcrR family transcriptional regulator [Actinomycetota bacterium]